LSAERECWEVRVGDVRDDQPECEWATPDQALRHTIRAVAEPLDDLLNPTTRGAAGRPLAGKHMGNRTDRDVRRASNVANGDSARSDVRLGAPHLSLAVSTHP